MSTFNCASSIIILSSSFLLCLKNKLCLKVGTSLPHSTESIHSSFGNGNSQTRFDHPKPFERRRVFAREAVASSQIPRWRIRLFRRFWSLGLALGAVEPAACRIRATGWVGTCGLAFGIPGRRFEEIRHPFGSQRGSAIKFWMFWVFMLWWWWVHF